MKKDIFKTILAVILAALSAAQFAIAIQMLIYGENICGHGWLCAGIATLVISILLIFINFSTDKETVVTEKIVKAIEEKAVVDFAKIILNKIDEDKNFCGEGINEWDVAEALTEFQSDNNNAELALLSKEDANKLFEQTRTNALNAVKEFAKQVKDKSYVNEYCQEAIPVNSLEKTLQDFLQNFNGGLK